ncbi:hypothetical protein NC653_024123 [Populus alba x Populus x berolinensis]|uniref:Beta-amylase n=1 Tax=Populus alba x Populus x berolinensis TaxID=444605 RepID=A0AAD6M851_9ROSI|nr:hypothetical protein NC653_024123 [Populus alba x Populus x berolinensis]
MPSIRGRNIGIYELDESKAAEEEKKYNEGKKEKEKGVPALKSAGVEGLMDGCLVGISGVRCAGKSKWEWVPAGELRYPLIPEQNGTWRFHEIGAFQLYMSSLEKQQLKLLVSQNGVVQALLMLVSTKTGREDTQFFRKEGGGWNSPYGEFFPHWYSQMLLDHGIHWHYGTRSSIAPELTAGYYKHKIQRWLPSYCSNVSPA